MEQLSTDAGTRAARAAAVPGDPARRAAGGRPQAARPPGAGAALAIFCFGTLRVLRAGTPLADWRSQRARSIFQYLVAHRHRPIPKEVLMDQFWPDVDRNAARNNLNVCIHGLRRILAPGGPVPWVRYRDDCYLLDPPGDIWVDAEVFARHADRAAELYRRGDPGGAMQADRAAIALYQDAYLADERHEWLRAVRAGYEATFLAVAERLGRHSVDRGDNPTAIALYLRMLAIDGCDEEIHRRLMRCYRRMGRSHHALRQFQRCRDQLAHELDTIPDPETVRLYDEIRCRQPAS